MGVDSSSSIVPIWSQSRENGTTGPNLWRLFMLKPVPIEPGRGGWVRALPLEENVAVYVRYELRKERLCAVELYLQPLADGEVNTDLMRLAFGEIDRSVRTGRMSTQVVARLGDPGPDLKRAAAAFSDSALGDLERTWVHDMLDAQVEGSGVPQAPYSLPRRAQGNAGVDAREVAADQCILHVPTGGGRWPNEFFLEVAKAYKLLAPLTDRPGAVLADVNGQDVVKVRKWIYIARKRGFLPPGRAGKVG
jgi:hypothetical protein